MKLGQAETRVKSRDFLADHDVRVFVSLVVKCQGVFCLGVQMLDGRTDCLF